MTKTPSKIILMASLLAFVVNFANPGLRAQDPSVNESPASADNSTPTTSAGNDSGTSSTGTTDKPAPKKKRKKRKKKKATGNGDRSEERRVGKEGRSRWA